MDCLFVSPDSSLKAYQGLSKKYSAIEPPTWALLLAESCRKNGHTVGILDTCAENLTAIETCKKIKEIGPRIVVLVVYGQNPNAGTTSMIGASILIKEMRESQIDTHISIVGSHASAEPKEVLENENVDSVIIGEGVYALQNLCKANLSNDLKEVKGLAWRSKKGELIMNEPERIVPQERMDEDLPGYAWDLLPYKERPLDLYRSHVWHGNFNEDMRTPYAAIYTSLGCIYGCDFCMINIVNRTNYDEGISASDSRIMRFWSPEWVIRELKKLNSLGVKTVRISDEMFLLNHKYYIPICEGIIRNKLDLHMWAYSRVDTVREKNLKLIKEAGINWLALGIEAGSQIVRRETSKGSFKDTNIRSIVEMIEMNEINVIANYIVGLPEDNHSTMIATMNLALELNTAMMNVYPCQALPGSELYKKENKTGNEYNKGYEEYAFLSYESNPLPTRSLTSCDILEFRDYFWDCYFKNPGYLKKVESLFGIKQRLNVEEMSKNKLKRKLIDEKKTKERMGLNQ